MKIHKTFLKAAALSITIILNAIAEVRSNDYGAELDYPYAMGWPFRTIPKFRHGALTGKGLSELEKKVAPFWLEASKIQTESQREQISPALEENAKNLIEKNTITAMLLIKNDKIILEKYQYKTDNKTKFDSQSMAKTFTALAIGALTEDGQLNDINQKISEVVPKLINSPIGRASIKQVLQMQCGNKFKWVDDGPNASAGKYAEIKFSLSGQSQDIFEYFKTLSADSPGAKFSYDPHCSDALSMLVTQLTGKTLREYYDQRIWQRLKPNNQAAWLSLSHNPNLTSGANSFYATLPDYGKLAMFFINEGKYNGETIISKSWIKSMHTNTVDVGDYPSNFKKYGYQTWVREKSSDSWFAALGNYGQRFYIDPISKSGMILFALDESHVKDSDKFWEIFRKLK
jgi:CubicO group peptidase (beta-lactamase class C family)